MYSGLQKNSLANSNSKHIEYWDANENFPLKPNEISVGSHVPVNWKCNICGHSWTRSVSAELKSKGCAVCNRQMLSKDYNFAKENPELVGDWIYSLNDGITPDMIMPNTHKKYYWKCPRCNNNTYMTPTKWKNSRCCSSCGRRKGIENRKKAVLQYDKEGNFLQRFNSARDAEKITGVSYKLISAVCNGSKKTAKGYVWKFE